jgi:hypothetical protein
LVDRELIKNLSRTLPPSMNIFSSLVTLIFLNAHQNRLECPTNRMDITFNPKIIFFAAFSTKSKNIEIG